MPGFVQPVLPQIKCGASGLVWVEVRQMVAFHTNLRQKWKVLAFKIILFQGFYPQLET